MEHGPGGQTGRGALDVAEESLKAHSSKTPSEATAQ
jgi:hypothetical protein